MAHCYPHSEAQKYSEDGTRLFVVCTRCGATLREVDPRAQSTRTLLRIVIEPFTTGRASFKEWCTAVDQLFPA